jgi:ATP-dependent Lhr-like helicase
MSPVSHDIKLSASDPLNLAGVILPGSRVPAVPSNFVVFKDGVIVRTLIGRRGEAQQIDRAQVAR